MHGNLCLPNRDDLGRERGIPGKWGKGADDSPMGFWRQVVKCRCFLTFAPARLYSILHARFDKYSPDGGERKILAPCELS